MKHCDLITCAISLSYLANVRVDPNEQDDSCPGIFEENISWIVRVASAVVYMDCRDYVCSKERRRILIYPHGGLHFTVKPLGR